MRAFSTYMSLADRRQDFVGGFRLLLHEVVDAFMYVHHCLAVFLEAYQDLLAHPAAVVLADIPVAGAQVDRGVLDVVDHLFNVPLDDDTRYAHNRYSARPGADQKVPFARHGC